MPHKHKAVSNLWDRGYRWTFAEIEISDQDHAANRTVVWQDVDHAPDFPVLSSFLEQWRQENRCATLCSVKVSTFDGVSPEDLTRAQISLSLH